MKGRAIRIASNRCISVVIIGAVGLGILVWGYLSKPSGDQKVVYRPAQRECFPGDAGATWNYCVHKSDAGTNGGIAYHLHGRGLSADTWNDDTFYTSLIQRYWADHGITPPTVVTISFGSVWVLAPKNAAPKSGLLERFISEVIPAVEKRIGQPRYRVVTGESMGGLNALIAGLHTKRLFRRVVSLCPPLYKGSPFDSWGAIRRFLKRTGADPKAIFGIVTLGRQYVASNADWKSLSPVEQVESVDPATAPEIYLSCGLYDKYGNFEGSEYFAERAAARGFKIKWRPIYGGHCAIDVASVAEFLAGVP